MVRKFRVKKLDKYKHQLGGCYWEASSMNKYIGQVGEAKRDHHDREGDYELVFEDGGSWYFHESWLEEVFDDPQPVDITQRPEIIEKPKPSSRYHRRIPTDANGYSDVYAVLEAFGVTNQAIGHAIKKLLLPGNRGHKDRATDLREAIASIERAIQLEAK